MRKIFFGKCYNHRTI